MKVKKSLVVDLLISAGYKTAPKFTEARVLKKVEELPQIDWEGKEPSSKALLDALISAVENGDPITLTGGEAEAPAKAKGKKAAAVEVAEEPEVPAKKASKKASKSKAAAVEVAEEVEEKPVKKAKKASTKKAAAEPADEEPTKAVPKKVGKGKGAAVAKKASPKKASKKSAEGKKPGIIATILATLQKASAKKPVSKDDMLAELVKAFPDRDADSMYSTINVQVPSRMRKEKGVIISRNNKGYWIES